MNSKLQEVNNILGIIDHLYHKAALKIDLSDSEFDMFYVISTLGDGCNQSLLYKKTGMRKSTVNTAIRRLEKEGVLYLQPGDKKNTKVFLTDKGKEYLKKVEAVVEAEGRVFQSWSEEDQQFFLEILKRYANQFEKEINELEI